MLTFYGFHPPTRRRWLHGLLLLLLVVVGFASARPAYAASITVDGTTCTLVDAITAANTDTATNGSPVGSPARCS